MVGSTLFVVFFIYNMIFLEPLQKKMKSIETNKTSTSDTTWNSSSKNELTNNKPANHKHKKQQMDGTASNNAGITLNNTNINIDSTVADSVKK